MPTRQPALSVDYRVSYRGVFFTRNPVGRLHLNVYDVLKDAGNSGVEAVQVQLQPGHGYVTGNLHDSVAARPQRASRGVQFTGRLTVITGRDGYQEVRRYSRKIDRMYKLMTNARRQVESWVGGNAAAIRARLVSGLS